MQLTQRFSTRASRQRKLSSFLVSLLVATCFLVGLPGSAGAASNSAKYVILVACPVTGPFAVPDGTEGQIVQAWAKWTNQVNGGVDGHQVQVVVANTQSDAAIAVSVLTQDIAQYHPDAIVTDDIAIETQIGAYLKTQDIPVIGSEGALGSIWSTYHNYFTSFSLDIPGALMQSFQAVGVKTFGAVVCAEVPVCATDAASLGSIAPKYGLTYKGYLTASATAPNYTAQCVAMQQKNVQALDLELGAATIASMIPNCQLQGYKGWYYVSELTGPQLSATPSGTQIVGTEGYFPWWSNSTPVRQFRSVMAKYGPSGLDYLNRTATGAWATVELFRTAMASASGSPSPSQVFNAYWKIKNQTLGGLLSYPITFTKGKPSPVNNCYWIYKYENGKTTTIHVGKSGNGQEGDLRSSCAS